VSRFAEPAEDRLVGGIPAVCTAQEMRTRRRIGARTDDLIGLPCRRP